VYEPCFIPQAALSNGSQPLFEVIVSHSRLHGRMVMSQCIYGLNKIDMLETTHFSDPTGDVFLQTSPDQSVFQISSALLSLVSDVFADIFAQATAANPPEGKDLNHPIVIEHDREVLISSVRSSIQARTRLFMKTCHYLSNVSRSQRNTN
jgi:hypothetical protein